MLDGQYGGLIVRDPPSKDPHYQLFDKDEIIIFLSDWMHELSVERYPGWYRHDLGQIAKNILINGLGQARVRSRNFYSAFFIVFINSNYNCF